MRKKITISEVAKVAGVSTTTVSRVMSGTGRISEKTRMKVFAVIDKLDYQPSAIAKGLIEAKTYSIGLILSREPDDYNFFENNFFQLFLQGIVTALKKFQFDIVISYGDETEPKTLERFIKKQKIEGIIVLKSYKHSQHILKLQKMSFPFLVLGKPENLKVPYVDSDNFKTIETLVEKFKKKCENRIGFIATDQDLNVNINKVTYLKEILANKNLNFDEEFVYLGNDFFDREIFLNNFMMESQNKLLITGDYNSLIYTINFCKENQIEIPKDVQIITFNDNPLLALFSPTISAIEIPAIKMGEQAANILLSIINREEFKEKPLEENTICYRGSTY